MGSVFQEKQSQGTKISLPQEYIFNFLKGTCYSLSEQFETSDIQSTFRYTSSSSCFTNHETAQTQNHKEEWLRLC